jgi:hypothetical protein
MSSGVTPKKRALGTQKNSLIWAALLDVHHHFGHNTSFFAGVETVVDRLLNGGEQGATRIVEIQ